MSVGMLQPVGGADPPTVFTRWINVVRDSVLPPVGPTCFPTVCNLTQGMAPDPFGSGTIAIAFAHTTLVSRESCHETRTDAAALIRIGAGEVGDELLVLVAEQRGLRREQRPGDAPKGIYRLARVVLGADAATKEERLVRRIHPRSAGTGGGVTTCARAAYGSASVRAMTKAVT